MKVTHYIFSTFILIASMVKPMDKAIKFGLAFLPTVTISVAKVAQNSFYNYWLKEDPKVLSPEKVSPDFRKFVHRECKAVGIHNPSSISILPYPDDAVPCARVVGSNTMEIGRYTILNYYYNDRSAAMGSKIDAQKKDLQKLNQLRFICQHEASHIKNKDHQRLVAAGIAIPSTTYALASMLRKTTSARNNLQRYLSAVAKGSLLGTLNFGLFILYLRHREQQADNGVQDTREILQGGINALKVAPHSFDPYHPSPQTRVRRLEERIVKLNE